jgi:hypothetical protein
VPMRDRDKRRDKEERRDKEKPTFPEEGGQ